MNVFKYRNGNEKDVDALINNYFFSPIPKDLNDPFESFVDDTSFKKDIDLFIKITGNQNSKEVIRNSNQFILNLEDLLLSLEKKVGYFSLSKNHLNEMMWALYANSHKGFCIEYDLDKLLLSEKFKHRYRIDVKYLEKPEVITIDDFNKIKIDNGKSIYTKKGGCKSKSWSHEEEIRIITDKIGRNNYESDTLKAVYFGVRMDEQQKNIIIDNLKGREIKFYQMELIKESYKLTYRPYIS